MYLQAVAERLGGKPFDDANMWRAAVTAMREILMKARAGRRRGCETALPKTGPRPRQFRSSGNDVYFLQELRPTLLHDRIDSPTDGIDPLRPGIRLLS